MGQARFAVVPVAACALSCSIGPGSCSARPSLSSTPHCLPSFVPIIPRHVHPQASRCLLRTTARSSGGWTRWWRQSLAPWGLRASSRCRWSCETRWGVGFSLLDCFGLLLPLDCFVRGLAECPGPQAAVAGFCMGFEWGFSTACCRCATSAAPLMRARSAACTNPPFSRTSSCRYAASLPRCGSSWSTS